MRVHTQHSEDWQVQGIMHIDSCANISDVDAAIVAAAAAELLLPLLVLSQTIVWQEPGQHSVVMPGQGGSFLESPWVMEVTQYLLLA